MKRQTLFASPHWTDRLPQLSDPTRGWPLAVLLAIFLLTGLWREPWKTEDALYFGVLWQAIASGQSTLFLLGPDQVPQPPLYYWLAHGLSRATHDFLPPVTAARLATTVFVVGSMLVLWQSARLAYGRAMAGSAPLLLIGCLGLLVASHDVQPMSAPMFGVALFCYALFRKNSRWGRAALLAVALLVLILGGGLRLLPAILLTMMIAGTTRRDGQLRGALVYGGIGGLLAAGIWWTSLVVLMPGAAGLWLAEQTTAMLPSGQLPRNLWAECVTLSWFAWPAWPLALWAAWTRRHRVGEPAMLWPLVLMGALALSLAPANDLRQSAYLVLLPPLTLLGVAGLQSLRRGGMALLDWFSRMTLGLLLIALALGYSAMHWGWPPKWAAKSASWAPGFAGGIEAIPLIAALMLVLAWLWILLTTPRSPLKSLFSWTGGLTVCWAVTFLLWAPWISHQRDYRVLAQSLQNAVPADIQCIKAVRFGEAQFALFNYYLQRPLLRANTQTPTPPCGAWLIQGHPDGEAFPPNASDPLWEGGRPGDRRERYRLYRVP